MVCKMVLETEAKIFQSSKAHTQHIMIPAATVSDSQHPFKSDERVRITVDPYHKMMTIASIEEPYIKVSCEGMTVKREEDDSRRKIFWSVKLS